MNNRLLIALALIGIVFYYGISQVSVGNWDPPWTINFPSTQGGYVSMTGTQNTDGLLNAIDIYIDGDLVADLDKGIDFPASNGPNGAGQINLPNIYQVNTCGEHNYIVVETQAFFTQQYTGKFNITCTSGGSTTGASVTTLSDVLSNVFSASKSVSVSSKTTTKDFGLDVTTWFSGFWERLTAVFK